MAAVTHDRFPFEILVAHDRHCRAHLLSPISTLPPP